VACLAKKQCRKYRSIKIGIEALSKIPEHGNITASVLLEYPPSTVPSNPKSQATENDADDNNSNVPVTSQMNKLTGFIQGSIHRLDLQQEESSESFV
jgi:hypothetical protein